MKTKFAHLLPLPRPVIGEENGARVDRVPSFRSRVRNRECVHVQTGTGGPVSFKVRHDNLATSGLQRPHQLPNLFVCF